MCADGVVSNLAIGNRGSEDKVRIAAAQRDGRTLAPTKHYFNDEGLVKLEVALARGKQAHDDYGETVRIGARAVGWPTRTNASGRASGSTEPC